MYTTVGTYYTFYMSVFLVGMEFQSNQDSRHMVVPPDDGPRYARNM